MTKISARTKKPAVITKDELEAVRVLHENLIKPRLDKIFRKFDQGAVIEEGSVTSKGTSIEREDLQHTRPFVEAYCMCISNHFPPYPRTKRHGRQQQEQRATRTGGSDA